jgi:hypothetical protein
MTRAHALLGCALLFAAACATVPSAEELNTSMNLAAEDYVRLVLAVGEHDPDYVDAYYGPAELREQVKAEKLSLASIRDRARLLHNTLRALPQPSEELSRLRHQYLLRQVESLQARVEMLSGAKFSFDDESKALYDAVAPSYPAEHFEAILRQLDENLPGQGERIDRLEAFRKDFIIPKDKLDTVFRAAIVGCRDRTMEHMELPPGETFTLEYVTNKSWSGYNWYQGDFKSLIQINTDLPIFIDRAIDLACHEGYPGHHVYNVLLEKNLVRDRGWKEFTVYPLFSPQSLIAEGSANYGIDVAFPQDERVAFEKRELFPLAGINPDGAERYYEVMGLVNQLSYAGNEAARRYLNGTMSADEAARWLTRYALMAPERARQRVRFFDQYRSYVINYNLGRDLVERHVETLGGTADNPERRWEIFRDLLASPRLPSSLKK